MTDFLLGCILLILFINLWDRKSLGYKIKQDWKLFKRRVRRLFVWLEIIR